MRKLCGTMTLKSPNGVPLIAFKTDGVDFNDVDGLDYYHRGHRIITITGTDLAMLRMIG